MRASMLSSTRDGRSGPAVSSADGNADLINPSRQIAIDSYVRIGVAGSTGRSQVGAACPVFPKGVRI
jgi:hypothetical protein